MAREGDSSTILAFLLGAVVGAGVTLLMAPWSGREARERIKTAAEDARDRAEAVLAETREKVSTVIEKGKGALEKERSTIKSALEAGKEAFLKVKGKPGDEFGKEEAEDVPSST